jgi:hypothetical protein
MVVNSGQFGTHCHHHRDITKNVAIPVISVRGIISVIFCAMSEITIDNLIINFSAEQSRSELVTLALGIQILHFPFYATFPSSFCMAIEQP